VIDALAVNSLA